MPNSYSQDIKKEDKIGFENKNNTSPYQVSDKTLLNYYTDKNAYSEIEVFDNAYSQALELIGGDKLLKPANSLNSVVIRNTSTKGLYKLVLYGLNSSFKIIHIDETELLNNRQYAKGTLSKINDDEYELTYFDEEDEIIIEHYNKIDTIDFMKKNKLVFQL